jgi:hypothetical protein
MAEPVFPVFSVPAPEALDFSCSNTCESYARSWSYVNARKWAPISVVRPAVPCAPPESYSGLLKAAEWQPTKRRVVSTARKVKLLVQNKQPEHAQTAAAAPTLRQASESSYESNTFITETAVCMQQSLMKPLPPAQPQRKRRWRRPKLGALWWRLEHVNGTQRWLLSGSDSSTSSSSNNSSVTAAVSSDASPVVAVSLCKSVAGPHTALLKQQCSALTDAGSMCSAVSATNTADQQSLCDTSTVDTRCNTVAAVDLVVKGLLLGVKGTGSAYAGVSNIAAPITTAAVAVEPLAAAAAAAAATAATVTAAAPQLSPRKPTSLQATSAACGYRNSGNETRGINMHSNQRAAAAAAAAAAATRRDDSTSSNVSALRVPSITMLSDRPCSAA